MNNQKTYIAMLIDESGSMSPHRSHIITSFNDQLKTIQEGAKEAGDTAVSIMKFNTGTQFLYTNQPAGEISPLSYGNYHPSGGTALLDAIGKTIEYFKSIDDGKATTAFLISILTDGEERDSCLYTYHALGNLIRELQATERFTFSLLGPKYGIESVARKLGIPLGNAAGFDFSSSEEVDLAMNSIVQEKAAYMSMRSAGVAYACNLYSGQASVPNAGGADSTKLGGAAGGGVK